MQLRLQNGASNCQINARKEHFMHGVQTLLIKSGLDSVHGTYDKE